MKFVYALACVSAPDVVNARVCMCIFLSLQNIFSEFMCRACVLMRTYVVNNT